jgi:hypothetical protein
MNPHAWNVERPHRLVVACSDGRLHSALDLLVHQTCGTSDADRLYVPGGPGAFVQGTTDLFRSDRWWRELVFLVVAHSVTDVLLVFHGAAEEGPEEAVCADYRRRLPIATANDVREWQRRDAAAIRQLFENERAVTHAQPSFVFAEVGRDHRIRFETENEGGRRRASGLRGQRARAPGTNSPAD